MRELTHKVSKWSLIHPLFPKHMSFILGPRQSGKTTVALQQLKNEKQDKETYYFNWDRQDIRRKFRDGITWLSTLKRQNIRPFLVFDEIHKTRQWKRTLKSIYDQYRDDFRFIVTGSGRLDHYQRGGDSLAGRYDPYFLYPFTPGEIGEYPTQRNLSVERLLDAAPVKADLIDLWEQTGGFPEPFLSASEAKAKSWWKQYQLRVTEEDLRDLTRLESVDLMREIMHILPSRIGSPLSIQSVRQDVETSFATAKRYLHTLNQLFLTFEISPYSKRIHRAVTKEKKIYYFHHAAVSEKGARFENMIAILLNRWISEMNESAIGDYSLHYVRDQDRREVDFLITKNSKPFILFEAKQTDTSLSPSLVHYSNKLNIPGVQVVRTPGINLKRAPHLAILSVHHLAGFLG